jgi:hydroxyethylthiazole kinase-like sugar kinase family protein
MGHTELGVSVTKNQNHMLFKIICSTCLVGFLIWLYIDHSTPSIIGACISALALAYNIFSPKAHTTPPPPSGPNFNITSGEGSYNNQSTEEINQTINYDSRTK